MTTGTTRNQRLWFSHYEKMVEGLQMQLMMPECTTTEDDTAALQRVLEIFERVRDDLAARVANAKGGRLKIKGTP
jgi:hypothetical protein